MADKVVTASRRLSPEFWAIVAVGVVVLGQAVWLDGRIESGGARLETEIEILQAGQADIQERLTLVDSYFRRTEWTPLAKKTEEP